MVVIQQSITTVTEGLRIASSLGGQAVAIGARLTRAHDGTQQPKRREPRDWRADSRTRWFRGMNVRQHNSLLADMQIRTLVLSEWSYLRRRGRGAAQ